MSNLQILRQKIQEARDAYYNGIESNVTDELYDSWINELRSINPHDPLLEDVGAKPSSLLEKAEHKIFMGSLDNSMNAEDFASFNGRVGGPYYVNPKVDGASIALYYKNGKLEKAITRGDGKIGDDITDNVRKFKNLPVQASYFSGSVRGEAVLFTKEWEQIDPDAESNPRNIGSGIIQRSDGENCNLMRLLAFDIYADGYPLKTEEEKIALLKSLGFEVPEGKVCQTAEDVQKEHTRLSNNRQSLPYWVDGLVVKANSLARQEELGMSGKRPKGQTAYKFAAQKISTVLEEIIWTVGHTGAQIPTGRVKPVRLGGTTVQHALLCNMDEIARLGIAVGDTVEIYKAGEIIPKIFRVTERPSNRKPIEEPTQCFVCGAKTQRRQGAGGTGAVTECSNPDCEARSLGKIKNYIKKVDILGVGDAIIESLVNNGLVKSIPDLYRLTEDQLAKLTAGTLVGEKRAKEIIKEFNKKRELTVDILLGSLGINHLGRRRVEIIRKNVKAKTGKALFETMEDWLDGKLLEYKDEAGVPGVGEAIQASIDRSKNMILDLLTEIRVVKPIEPKSTGGSLSGKKFCLTGAMSKKRSEIAADIKAKGGLVFDDVAGADVILVQADPSSESSKSKKAKKIGAKIMSEEDLNAMMV